MSETFLVTGGAGFIGSHVVDELVRAEHKVLVLDDLTGGFRENVHPQAEFVQGSINDVTLVNKIFKRHSITYLYHLAAYAAEGLSHFIRRFNYTNNLIGSVNLINTAINYDVECFIFTSSIAVYGSSQPPMHENMIPQPEDPYGIAKFAVEQDLKVCHDFFGLDYIVFRPHNVYGERQNIGDRYRNVIGIFMSQIMQNQPMTIFGDGTQTRAFSYIGDVAPIIAHSPQVPEARNQVFNIGAETPYTVDKLATKVAHHMGLQPSVTYLGARKEVQHAYASHEKAERVFNYRPKYSLDKGLARMAKWAKSVGIQRSRIFSDIEVSKNMPPVWRREVEL